MIAQVLLLILLYYVSHSNLPVTMVLFVIVNVAVLLAYAAIEYIKGKL